MRCHAVPCDACVRCAMPCEFLRDNACMDGWVGGWGGRREGGKDAVDKWLALQRSKLWLASTNNTSHNPKDVFFRGSCSSSSPVAGT
eukprot:364631-Chlamydomonas_euryale.AAC.1